MTPLQTIRTTTAHYVKPVITEAVREGLESGSGPGGRRFQTHSHVPVCHVPPQLNLQYGTSVLAK